MAWRAAAGLIVVIATVAAVGGCKSGSEPGAPPVVEVDEQRLTAVKADYAAQRPGTVVGRVVGVDEEEELVAVAGMDPQPLQRGSVVVFANGEGAVVATGQVERITGRRVHVRYDPPQAGQRLPVDGDLAVHVPVR